MAKGGLWDYDSRVYLAKKYRTQLASAPASFLAVLAGSPMENVKTRMQSKHFKNALECIRYTHTTEGVRGFWAGTTAPLISITISRVAGFSVYQWAKYAIDGVIESSTGHSPLKLVNTPGTYPDLSTVGCFTTAGAISGAALAFVISPFELIKNATQTSVLMASSTTVDATPRGPSIGSVAPKSVGRVSSWRAVKQIVERRGVLGLWTGFQLHMARDLVGSGIYFGVYEAVKQSITSYRGVGEANTIPAVATAGVICGVLSWVFTYPLDTMKTRAQNRLVGNSSSSIDALSKAVARSSKWKGVEMIILRSSIQNMIQMSIFESVKTEIIGMKFSDGRTDLPKTKREKGRTDKVH